MNLLFKEPIVAVDPHTLLDTQPFDMDDIPWPSSYKWNVDPDAIESYRRSKYYYYDHYYPETVVSGEQHMRRIAYLMDTWVNDGSDPVCVEVHDAGISGVIVHDGCHRLFAAILRGDEYVYVSVSGFLDIAEEIFDVVIDKGEL